MKSWYALLPVFLAVLAGMPSARAQTTAPAAIHARSGRQAAADTLFTNRFPLFLRLEVSKASVASLRRRPREWTSATLREGDVVYTNLAIKLKGGAGSFRSFDDKPGLTLKFEDGGGAFHGLKKLHLNNSVQDESYLSEWACGEMFRQAGVPTPRAAHAWVELNGRKLGLYVLLESVNRDFLARYFPNPRGNVYGQSGNADVTDNLELRTNAGQAAGHDDLEALAEAARGPVARLAQVLDMDRFLSFMAMEVLFNHWDGYTMNVKNYLVYHDPDAGKMTFIPHDLDQLFRDSQESILPRPHGRVAQAVLKDADLRRRYLSRCAELYTNVLARPEWPGRIEAKAAELSAAIAKWDPAAARQLEENAGQFVDRLQHRSDALAKQLQVPGFGMPQFTNGIVALRGWRPVRRHGQPKLGRVEETPGQPALWISAPAPASASWRMKVSLEPGRYVLEGFARGAGIQPPANPEGWIGAGLRAAGTSGAKKDRLMGDAPRRRLACEFQVADDFEEVELICELRAARGEVWFEESTLQLRRLE